MTIDPTSEQLAALVRDFLDPDPCALDHHGYCQTHSWLCEGRCPHARAREVLAEYDAEQAASAGAAPADEPAPAGLGVSATPSHTDQAAVLLSKAERLMLRHALDLADANVSARPDEYTAADEAALTSLRSLADEAQQPEPSVHGESVAHLAGLHDDEPTVDARQDGAQS